MRGFPPTALSGVVGVDGFFVQHRSQFLAGGRLFAAQKDRSIHVADDGIGIVLVNGLQLALRLQYQTGRISNFFVSFGIEKAATSKVESDGLFLTRNTVSGNTKSTKQKCRVLSVKSIFKLGQIQTNRLYEKPLSRMVRIAHLIVLFLTHNPSFWGVVVLYLTHTKRVKSFFLVPNCAKQFETKNGNHTAPFFYNF